MIKLLICTVTALSCIQALGDGRAAASAFAQAGEKHRVTVEDEIAALEHSWAAAQRTNDPATIAALLAEEFVEVLPDGSLMNKSQVLDDAKNSKYEMIKISDLKITRFGDIVIVIGTFDAKHSGDGAKPMEDHERYVDTWRKMPDGKWQCIAEGNTAIR